MKSVGNAAGPLEDQRQRGAGASARGGNWGWDELLRRMPPERMDAAVRMHRDMNFTMIRNWVGSSDREEFFAGCDENGILVWNDFPNAWGMDPPDHDAYNAIAPRHRPALPDPPRAWWCGAAPTRATRPPRSTRGCARRWSRRPRACSTRTTRRAGSSPAAAPTVGSTRERTSTRRPTAADFGFHTEIGMPVVSTAASVRNMTGDEPEWPIRGAWFYHDWSEHGNQAAPNYQAAIEARLGHAGGLDDFARKAQFVNYENTRAMFEAWNAKLWNNATGLMLWMSHPAWHSTVWQTYDYDFDVNGTYYGARKGCEPLHVQADPADWQVLAVNHTAADADAARPSPPELYDLSGRSARAGQAVTVDVPRAATARPSPPAGRDDLPDLHLLRLTPGGRQRNGCSRENTYWRYRDAARTCGPSTSVQQVR